MKKIFYIIIPCFITLTLSAQRATNVVARQVGKKVEVTYNLDKMCDVTLSVSYDGGITFSAPLKQVKGDAGINIPAGTRTIVWDVLKERESLVNNNVSFRVNTSANSIKEIYNGFIITINGVSFTLINVPGGTYSLTNYKSVTLSPYSIGETEVTQELWELVMGYNPSMFKGADKPVENISWRDCQKFIGKINALLQDQLSGYILRLPTECEWECAARGGQRSNGYSFSGSFEIKDVAWYKDNSGGITHPTKQLKPNELGIYDMNGNVWEWCFDWGGVRTYLPIKDPKGSTTGTYKIIKGGSYNSKINDCYVWKSDEVAPESTRGIGIRLVLSKLN